MPEVSRFYGIVILMWPNDHPPPHFHARCGSQEIAVYLDGSARGDFPVRKLKLIRKWLTLHGEELALNWSLLEHGVMPRYIEPLD